MDEGDQLTRLAIALAIGLIVGAQRGWQARERAEGQRVAGIRTFGLLGLLGGVAALLGRELGGLVPAAALVAVAAFLLVGHWQRTRDAGDVGATTETAAVLTFLLGGLAVLGPPVVAAAAAVVTALLLQMKPVLHGWLRRTEPEDLLAALQLLLVSVVVLPFLPDRGFGPGSAINPYRLWWMVVLICALTFAGHVAMRWFGAARGVLAVGLFGGLASSTAVTLSLARQARAHPELGAAFAAGILLAFIVMLARIALVAFALAPGLARALAVPLGAAAVVGVLAGAWLLRRGSGTQAPERVAGKPIDILMALQLAVVLAVVLALAELARDRLGDAGLSVLAVLAGLTDVDAITLAAAELVGGGMAVAAGAQAVLLAAGTNTLVKAGMTVVIAGGTLARIVVAVSAAMLVAGALAVLTVGR